MTATYLTNSVILATAMDVFKNKLTIGNTVWRDVGASEFSGAQKIGESFQIENPWRFDIREGTVQQVQHIQESSVTMSITNQIGVDLEFSNRDRQTKIRNFKERFLDDAMTKMANKVDSLLMAEYVNIGNTVGTAGTTPTTYAVFGDAGALLDSCTAPDNDRSCVMNPKGYYAMVDEFKGVFQLKMVNGGSGTSLGPIHGVGNVYSSNNIKNHTAGTSANMVIDGLQVAGSSVLIKTGTGTHVVGDVVTFANVFRLNPVSYESTGELMQFTVTELLSGTGTLKIAPAMVVTGPTRNISALPVDGAAVTVFGASDTYKVNLAYNKKAIAFCTVPIILPETAVQKETINRDGISMSMIGDWDQKNFYQSYRIDMLVAIETLRPEFACRIAGE